MRELLLSTFILRDLRSQLDRLHADRNWIDSFETPSDSAEAGQCEIMAAQHQAAFGELRGAAVRS